MDSGLRPPLQSTSHPRDNEPDDLEKLKKWQEDRLQRKLRGEYESALLHLNEVVSCVHSLLLP
jgi:outer membrane protein insertion porin family